ncbi:MAG: hypothetical protein P4M05_25785 [Bradyrhizobium sp.]|nr:hypothetical protein [Bradyrhizobium sp.]
MANDIEVIWVKRTPEYFCAMGWTGGSVICPPGKITPLRALLLQIKRAICGTGQSIINGMVKEIYKSKSLLIEPDLPEIPQWRSD